MIFQAKHLEIGLAIQMQALPSGHNQELVLSFKSRPLAMVLEKYRGLGVLLEVSKHTSTFVEGF